jgi:hypothetical protein
VSRQVRHGQSFQDVSSMLDELAHATYYDHQAQALAHRVAVEQCRRNSPGLYEPLPPFSFPSYGSPDYPAKVWSKGRQAGRQAGGQTNKQACKLAGSKAGMQEGPRMDRVKRQAHVLVASMIVGHVVNESLQCLLIKRGAPTAIRYPGRSCWRSCTCTRCSREGGRSS